MNDTIQVTIRTFATLREHLHPEFTLSLPRGATVDKLFQAIYEQFPAARKEIQEEGSEDPFSTYIILKNGRNIVHIKKERTELEEGDTISVFPPIGGGVER